MWRCICGNFEANADSHNVKKHTPEVWFSNTDLVRVRPLGKNKAKLLLSLLKKEDGSREQKKKSKVGQKDCNAAPVTNGLFLHFVKGKKRKRQDNDE